MDANEMIRVGPEVARTLGPLAAAIPFTAIVRRMLGPAADELAEIWRDQVRLYRYGRQVECVEKAEKMALDAGFTPSAVSPKILFPLLEGASMEEDENLHTMWSALLANASSEAAGQIRPSFVRILQDMAPDEARLLQEISDQGQVIEGMRNNFNESRYATLSDKRQAENALSIMEHEANRAIERKFMALAGEQPPQTRARFQACIQSLESARLVVEERSEGGTSWELSNRGRLFLDACSPPKRKS
jgi:hypothetical protein